MEKSFSFEKIDDNNSVMRAEGFYLKLITITGHKYTVLVVGGTEYLLRGDFSAEYENILNAFMKPKTEKKKLIPTKIPPAELLAAARTFYNSCPNFQIQEPISRLQPVTPLFHIPAPAIEGYGT